MSRITAGIFDATDDIKNEYDGAHAFQEAILTSDTCTKSCSAKIEASLGEITVGGVVKGAGMIEPNMATMLAFLTTDICATNSELQSILTDAVNKSFNRITIDGDMSTNDSVLIMANGNSGIELSEESKKFQNDFADAVDAVCAELARKCNLPRQTVAGWDALKRGPHEKSAKKFWDFYEREILSTNVAIAKVSLSAKTKVAYDSERAHHDPRYEEAWEQVILPYFFSLDYFHNWRNRKGVRCCRATMDEECLCNGLWKRKGQDYYDFYRLFEQGRVAEILGLSLLL